MQWLTKSRRVNNKVCGGVSLKKSRLQVGLVVISTLIGVWLNSGVALLRVLKGSEFVRCSF